MTVATLRHNGAQLTRTALGWHVYFTSIHSNGRPVWRGGPDELRALEKLANVHSVTFNCPFEETETLDFLPLVDDLRELTFSHPGSIDDDVMANVAKCRTLKKLAVIGGVSDDGFKNIESLHSLEILTVFLPQLTDEGVAVLGRLQKLRQVALAGSKVTDKGLVVLASLPKLEVLNLNGTGVTDKSEKLFMALPSLKILRIEGTGVTRSTASRLREAMPNCTVFWTKSAGVLDGDSSKRAVRRED